MATNGSELLVSSLLMVTVASLGEPPSYPVPEASARTTVSCTSTSVSTTGVMVTVAVVAPLAMVTVPAEALKLAAPLTV